MPFGHRHRLVAPGEGVGRVDHLRLVAEEEAHAERVVARPRLASQPHVKTLTARAITRPITTSETIDCNDIVSFAQAVMGMTSVGLNAVLVVTPRTR